MKYDVDAILDSGSKPFNVDVGQRDDGAPVGFVVLGTSSEAYAKADREIQLINVKQAGSRKGIALDSTTDEGAAFIVDGTEEFKDIVFKHCVLDWYGFTKGETEPAEFSMELFLKLIRARPLWARKLLVSIEDEANFVVG